MLLSCLTKLPNLVVCANSDFLKCFGVGQPFDQNLVGHIVDDSLNELIAHGRLNYLLFRGQLGLNGIAAAMEG